MTEKIYLSPAVADVTDERLKQVVRELRTIRHGHEANLWDEEIEVEELDEEE